MHPNGEVRWWTFGGGIANTLFADHLRSKAEIQVDNLSLRFPTSMKLNEVQDLVEELSADLVEPVPAQDAIKGLKFSECLPPLLAAEVFCARFNDAQPLKAILDEPRRVVVEN